MSLHPTDPTLPPLPEPVQGVADALESQGIQVWQQGDALLERHLSPLSEARPAGAPTATCFLCAATGRSVAAALPKAVITAADERRLSLGTAAGPVDLLPLGNGRADEEALQNVLSSFGLSPWAIAIRPATGEWTDPSGALPELMARRFPAMAESRRAFEEAPRRFWLAARLAAEHDLAPSSALIEAASEALPEALPRMPLGAPARRELQRVLMAPAPARGLGFLRRVGLVDALFPKIQPEAEEIVSQLPRTPALRWAGWLSGTSTQASLRRWRMPHDLAREIDRLLRVHPLDQTTRTLAEAGLRRLAGRWSAEEREQLFDWRRLEIERMSSEDDARQAIKRLDDLRQRFDALEGRKSTVARIDALGIDGATIMRWLNCSPGRIVGEALKHLADFADGQPDGIPAAALESELKSWFASRENAQTLGDKVGNQDKTASETDARPLGIG